MRFGVYGCRHMHIEQAVRELRELGHRCVGVLEPEGPFAAQLMKMHNLQRLSGEEELLEQKPELILSSAVNDRKMDIVEWCEKHRLHIMVDKPAVVSREGYERLEEVIRRGEIQVGMMLTERFHPVVWSLHKALQSGVIGELVGVSFSKPHKLNPDARESWHFDKVQNGGPVLDLLIHDFDMLCWFADSKVTESSGFLTVGNREGYPELYTDAKITARTENNVTALLHADWWTPEAFPYFGNGRVILTGTRGRIEGWTIGDPSLGEEGFATISTNSVAADRLEISQPPCGLMEDFLRRIGGEACVIGGEDLLRCSLAAVEADERAVLVGAQQELLR